MAIGVLFQSGTDADTNEYFNYRQELEELGTCEARVLQAVVVERAWPLEDERDALGARIKREERLLEGQKGLRLVWMP